MQPAARVAAFLLLLGLSYAATTERSRPTLMQLRSSWHKQSTTPKSVAVSTASDHGEYEEPVYDHKLEEKEICLVEVARKACSVGGAANVDEQRLWTSDVACCSENDYGRNSEGRYGPGLANRLVTPSNAVGSCDWSAFFTVGNTVSAGISRIGKASALCYFSGADAHTCGGPLCDRLVISIEGSVYRVTTAYSHYPKANVNDAGCNQDTFWQNGRMMGMGAWIEGGDQYAQYQYAQYAQQYEQQQQLEQQMYQQQYQQQQYDTQVNANLQGHSRDRDDYRDDHRDSYGNDGYGNDYRNTRAVYSGAATIINGIVTAFAGQRKEKWDEGIFEYTPSFEASATPYTGALNPSYPWVQDNTYKFTFYKHGAY